jgi:hypothetical protein
MLSTPHGRHPHFELYIIEEYRTGTGTGTGTTAITYIANKDHYFFVDPKDAEFLKTVGERIYHV